MFFEKIHLEENERVIRIVRKHWFILLQKMLGIIFITVLPLVGWILLDNTLQQQGLTSIDITAFLPYVTFFYALWVLINWMAMAYAWTDHYLDIWTITDRRIIKIDQVRFFDRQIGSFRLEKLQDMNVEIKGILGTLLDYGTVEAQTASGNEEEFRAHYLPHPRELKSAILTAADNRMSTPSTHQSDT